MRYVVLNVKAAVLKESIKNASIAHAAGGQYILIVSPEKKNELNTVTLHCVSEGIQSSCRFMADIRQIEEEDNGNEKVVQEPLDKIINVALPAMFADVVIAFEAVQENIFLLIKENEVIVKNSMSTIPLPLADKIPLVKNPKNLSTLQLTVDREEFYKILKPVANALTVRDNRFSSSFYSAISVLPLYQEERAVLDIAAISGYISTNGQLNIITTSPEFPTQASGLKSAMLDAGNLMSIASITAEKMRLTFYINEAEKRVEQCNVSIGNCLFQMRPCNVEFPMSARKTMDVAIESHIFRVLLKPKDLRNALNILMIGKEPKKMVIAKIAIKGKTIIVTDAEDVKRSTVIENVKIEGETDKKICSSVKVLQIGLAAFEERVWLGLTTTQGLISMRSDESVVKTIVTSVNINAEEPMAEEPEPIEEEEEK